MARSLLKNLLQNKADDHPLRIKLLGDSITHGVGGTGFSQNGEPIVECFARNPDGYCWANQLKQSLEQTGEYTVINNACTGTTIEFVISNFDQLVDAEDDLILCAIGTNNRHQLFVDGPKRTEQDMRDSFYRNIEILWKKCVERSIPVIFVANIPNSAENECDGDYYWRILHMWDIRNLYVQASAEFGFPLIDLYTMWNKYCEENGVASDALLADGIHPNDAGQDVILTLILLEIGDS